MSVANKNCIKNLFVVFTAFSLETTNACLEAPKIMDNGVTPSSSTTTTAAAVTVFTISYPGTGSAYSSNEFKCWNLTVDAGLVIKFDLTSADIETCCDYITIYDSHSTASPVGILNVQGNVRYSSSNTAQMCFTSDGTDNRQGFTLSYQGVDSATVEGFQFNTPPPPAAVTSTCGHSRYYNTTLSSGIVGGLTAQPNQYPWIARLSIGSSSCGGTIISPTFVITAAHCTDQRLASQITVIVGDHDSSDTTEAHEQNVSVTAIIQHPSFVQNSITFDYDYSLLQLSTTLDFSTSYIQPICLPQTCQSTDACTTAGQPAYIAGWGKLSLDGPDATVLQTAYVTIQSLSDCTANYAIHSLVPTDQSICAGYTAGSIDSCQGDSGGPLMSVDAGYYKLCGITSWGKGCAEPNLFGVYAKICTIRSWIDQNVNDLP